jgi:beta-phosphoglucomutase-like phosphatase (HAD superfamily)
MHKKALLLDCDGVLVESEPLNFKCWNLAFMDMTGYSIQGDYHQLVGLELSQLFELWNAQDLSQEQKDSILKKKQELFYELGTELEPIPGIQNLIDHARKLDYGIAIVSAALSSRLNFTLRQIGIFEQADIILPGETVLVKHGYKKDYRRAALMLNAHPDSSIVLEDSPSGIQSALFSKIRTVIGYTSTFCSKELLAFGAHHTVSSIDEVIPLL